MGQRGPAPKPAELKVLEGGRGHRPLNLDQTFRPEVGVPDAPKWLLKESRKAWKRLSAELVYYNLLSKVDREALALMCQTVGRIDLLERAILAKMKVTLAAAGDGAASNAALRADVEALALEAALTATTPNGLPIQSALYQILNKEQSKLSNYLAEFGLTPAQRARVTTAIRRQGQLFPVPTDGVPADPATPATGFAGFPEN